LAVTDRRNGFSNRRSDGCTTIAPCIYRPYTIADWQYAVFVLVVVFVISALIWT